MPQVVITPWRDQSELIKIRAQFFPPSHGKETDMRRKAVNMVNDYHLGTGNANAKGNITGCCLEAQRQPSTCSGIDGFAYRRYSQ